MDSILDYNLNVARQRLSTIDETYLYGTCIVLTAISLLGFLVIMIRRKR
ncbi:MAG: hypothetical protein PHQ27_08135 [Victivallales bacterium]|nr:hypothetical protein [Victivallales bacterium]